MNGGEILNALNFSMERPTLKNRACRVTLKSETQFLFNFEEIGDVLKAAREAGATFAGSVILRLPGPVKDVFEQRLRAALPLRAEKVLRRIRDTRGGKLYDSRFGTRGTGEGVYADAIRALFDQTAKRLGFLTGLEFPSAKRDTFERPHGKKGQLGLF